MENKSNQLKSEKTKILLIKRDETVAGAFGKKLSDEGFDVKIMNNPGENFFDEITEFMPEFIVTGIMLNSNISGLDIIKKIKAIKEMNRVKIIVLTAVESEDAKNEATALGINDYYISTLITPSQMAQKVAEIIEKPS